MSDDTPSQRFNQDDLNPAGDAPTERLATPGPAAPGAPVTPTDARSRRTIIILAIIGGLLLIAVLAVLVILLTRGTGSATSATTATPSASASATQTPSPTPTKSATPTPTPTPTPTKTVAPPPPSTAPSIDNFTVSPTTVYCNTHTPGGPFNQYLDMTWSTTNADTVTIGTYDPYGDYAGQYFNLPNDGDTTTQGLQITYNCPEASQVWRLEVKGQDGSTIKKEIKIVNKGDQS